MKKARKALLTLCAALLLVSMTVGVTVAYLTSTTGVVTNTFTVGQVVIELDETKVDVYGVDDPAVTNPVKGNNYKLIPGHHYTKDPTVHVKAESEACYVFIKVVNGIAGIEGTSYTNADGETVTTKTIAEQITANNWLPLEGQSGVYYYKDIVADTDADQHLKVFETFTIDGNAAVDQFTNAQVTIDAYAIQADGFTSAQTAWAANAVTWEN